MRKSIIWNTVCIIVSYIIAFFIRNIMVDWNLGEYSGFVDYIIPLLGIIILFLILYYIFHILNPAVYENRLNSIVKIILVNVVGVVIFCVSLYLCGNTHFPRTVILFFFIINTGFAILVRRFYLE